MASALTTGEPVRFFLERFGLDQRTLEQIVGNAIARRADYADLYFEFRTVQSLSLEEGLVKSASQHVAQGVGVRVVAGDKTGYAYSDDVTVDSLQLATRTAQAIAQESGETRAVAVSETRPSHDLYTLQQSPLEAPLADKVELLNRIDIAARRQDARIKNVMASIGVEQKLVLIVSSAGWVVGDVQPLVRLNVTCIAEEAGNRQQGTYGGGGRVEFAFLTEGDRYLRFTRTAAEHALRNLRAVDAPAGTMTVVLGPGWPGVL
jgi:TldD protein